MYLCSMEIGIRAKQKNREKSVSEKEIQLLIFR